jgi:hypothetical protein
MSSLASDSGPDALSLKHVSPEIDAHSKESLTVKVAKRNQTIVPQ